jgi:hypothetical protein
MEDVLKPSGFRCSGLFSHRINSETTNWLTLSRNAWTCDRINARLLHAKEITRQRNAHTCLCFTGVESVILQFWLSNNVRALKKQCLLGRSIYKRIVLFITRLIKQLMARQRNNSSSPPSLMLLSQHVSAIQPSSRGI